jgi:hypothetical protein
MRTTVHPYKAKLWLGFGVMGLAVVIWSLTMWWMTGAIKVPKIKPGSTPAEIEAAVADQHDPMAMMERLMIGEALGGIVLLGGMVITAMGLIDYAAEMRSRPV